MKSKIKERMKDNEKEIDLFNNKSAKSWRG